VLLAGNTKVDLKKKSFEILNALDKPILVIDRSYHIVAANSAACRSFCLNLDSIVGQECFKLTHKVDVPCWKNENKCPVKLAFESRKKTKVIHQHNYAGKAIIEEVIANPIFDTQGDVNFIIEELNDVTDLIQSKEIIEHLKKEVNTLRGIIPICSACKNIRDDKGYWQQVEAYIRDRSEAEFSHSICPECFEKLYPELDCKN
jgi:PAS domain S-box-containing protein